jgi:hypothetical protein
MNGSKEGIKSKPLEKAPSFVICHCRLWIKGVDATFERASERASELSSFIHSFIHSFTQRELLDATLSFLSSARQSTLHD